jgi:hypothetical protein
MLNYTGSASDNVRAVFEHSAAFVNARPQRKTKMLGTKSEIITFKSSKALDKELLNNIAGTVVTDDKKQPHKVVHNKSHVVFGAAEDYNAVSHNCAGYCEGLLNSATGGHFTTHDVYPATVFDDIKRNKEAIQAQVARHDSELQHAKKGQE